MPWKVVGEWYVAGSLSRGASNASPVQSTESSRLPAEKVVATRWPEGIFFCSEFPEDPPLLFFRTRQTSDSDVHSEESAGLVQKNRGPRGRFPKENTTSKYPIFGFRRDWITTHSPDSQEIGWFPKENTTSEFSICEFHRD